MPGPVPSRHPPTLLVHCDLDAASSARTALAVDLARRTGARLVGAAGAAPKPLAGSPRLAAPLLAGAEDDLRRALDLVAEEFMARAADTERVHWRSALKPAHVVLTQEAVAADLVIVGPQSLGAPGGPLALDTAALVMCAGRPVLIAPKGLERLDLRRVVVGWKSGREARRALMDCVPWLELVEEVLILHVVESADGRLDPCLEAARDWLSYRGARVEAEHRAARLDSVADDLLAAADSFGAGLIVAGAYSRAPLNERLFGGVTREFLKRGRPARLLNH